MPSHPLNFREVSCRINTVRRRRCPLPSSDHSPLPYLKAGPTFRRVLYTPALFFWLRSSRVSKEASSRQLPLAPDQDPYATGAKRCYGYRMTDPRDEQVRRFFEELPEDMRAIFLDTARSALAVLAEERGIPAQELVTPNRVNELAVTLFQSHGDRAGDELANLEEFFTEEERRKIYTEEGLRLSEQYPEGVPSDVWAQAVIQRMQRERPEWHSN